ncbi:MAG: sugar kinase [Myxococcales bacterium]|nr:sugar kinase [Myxococcales bacterium]
MTGPVVCFGELLLRLTAPNNERLMQSLRLDVGCGGAEANVAISLAHLGHQARMVSSVPQNRLGDACVDALRSYQVDVSGVQVREGRMGLYFLESGVITRPSRVVYDREGSTFANMRSADYDWETILADVAYLHVTGITPATGAGPAEATIAAAEVATRLGAKVSFDGNYREALWQSWGGDGAAVLKSIVSRAHVAFITERDIALLLKDKAESREEAVRRAFDEFPSLQYIAATNGTQESATALTLAGELYTRGRSWSSRTYRLDNIVGRIGRGDAFAAGILHGLISGYEPQRVVNFAAAACVIKHSIPGDWNLTNISEVEATMYDSGFDVRR